MKFLITENKIIDVAKRYLNTKNYKQINVHDRVIYFYQDGNFLADIVLDINDKFAEINFQLVDDIKSFFSIDKELVMEIIRSWIEDATGINYVEVWAPMDYHRSELYLPNKK